MHTRMVLEYLSAAHGVANLKAEVKLLWQLHSSLVEGPLVPKVSEQEFAKLASKYAHGKVTSCVSLNLRVLHFYSHIFTTFAKSCLVNLSE